MKDWDERIYLYKSRIESLNIRVNVVSTPGQLVLGIHAIGGFD